MNTQRTGKQCLEKAELGLARATATARAQATTSPMTISHFKEIVDQISYKYYTIAFISPRNYWGFFNVVTDSI